MKILGIIQPGKIGDIIICLPIAKYYYDLGYKILWPVPRHFISHFKNIIDYVEFVTIKNISTVCTEAKNVLEEYKCDNILHLGFGWEDTFELEKKFYQSGKQFDKFKYDLANVPFEEKWNLNITRNKSTENDLYNKIIKDNNYIVQHLESSDKHRNDIKVDLDNCKHNGINQIVTINKDLISKLKFTNGIFDWLTILENSQALILIDSVFVNLIDQLGIQKNGKIICLKKDGYPPQTLPTLRNNWQYM